MGFVGLIEFRFHLQRRPHKKRRHPSMTMTNLQSQKKQSTPMHTNQLYVYAVEREGERETVDEEFIVEGRREY